MLLSDDETINGTYMNFFKLNGASTLETYDSRFHLKNIQNFVTSLTQRSSNKNTNTFLSWHSPIIHSLSNDKRICIYLNTLNCE